MMEKKDKSENENKVVVSIDQLQEELDTSPQGLSKEDVQNRLKQYGYNELVEKKSSPVIRCGT